VATCFGCGLKVKQVFWCFAHLGKAMYGVLASPCLWQGGWNEMIFEVASNPFNEKMH